MKVWELVSIVLSALVAGMFYGPWAALSRSLRTFSPEVFLAIVDRMNRNMAPLMTPLLPAAVLSILPVVAFSYRVKPWTFYLSASAFVLMIASLMVTVVVEVPIVEEIVTWKVSSLPDGWERKRDRWMAFHRVRVVAGLGSLVLLVAGAVF